jgi:y4mF family transcriptional regulator
MTPESTIDSPAAAGAIIRARRTAKGLSQQTLADRAGVSRKFLIDLEAGHDRAELGKTLAVTAALGLTLAATDPIPRGSDFDPARRDYAATFSRLIAERTLSSRSKCSPTTPRPTRATLDRTDQAPRRGMDASPVVPHRPRTHEEAHHVRNTQ